MLAHADPGVQITDRSDEVALLALQGPAAEELLAPLTALDLTALPYFGYARAAVAGLEWGFLARTGYTGEDGFELFVRAPEAPMAWDALVEAGARPCGLATRDVCRLEAGLRLYGTDMDESTNPYEAGLGWTVKLDKGSFVGRDALARIREAGPARKLAGLRGRDRLIPRHGAEVRLGASPVGQVTGGTHSFWLGAGIGMAMMATAAAQPGSVVEVESRGGFGEASVERLPFYRGSVRTPAPSQKN
jgi:aminomethyltransferase